MGQFLIKNAVEQMKNGIVSEPPQSVLKKDGTLGLEKSESNSLHACETLLSDPIDYYSIIDDAKDYLEQLELKKQILDSEQFNIDKAETLIDQIDGEQSLVEHLISDVEEKFINWTKRNPSGSGPST